jgi:AraC-like DNA-binding protein/ligand-binding sensor protein
MLTVDKEELERVLTCFHQITGFRIAIFDHDRKEVAAAPKSLSGFCARLRENPEALEMCRECDRHAFEKARATNELFLYRCAFGLHEAVTPIESGGRIIGYMMIGQMLSDSEPSREIVRSRTAPYWRSDEDRNPLIDELPLLDVDRIKASAYLMSICAAYLIMSGRLVDRIRSKEDRLMDFIRANYTQNHPDKELCNRFRIPRTTYYRIIRDRCGMPRTAFVNGLRVDESKNLLAFTALPIKDIAERLGFGDPNYFARIFRSMTGISPRQYREAQQRPLQGNPSGSSAAAHSLFS